MTWSDMLQTENPADSVGQHMTVRARITPHTLRLLRSGQAFLFTGIAVNEDSTCIDDDPHMILELAARAVTNDEAFAAQHADFLSRTNRFVQYHRGDDIVLAEDERDTLAITITKLLFLERRGVARRREREADEASSSRR